MADGPSLPPRGGNKKDAQRPGAVKEKLHIYSAFSLLRMAPYITAGAVTTLANFQHELWD